MFPIVPALWELEADVVTFWLWAWSSSHADRLWHANVHGAAA